METRYPASLTRLKQKGLADRCMTGFVPQPAVSQLWAEAKRIVKENQFPDEKEDPGPAVLCAPALPGFPDSFFFLRFRRNPRLRNGERPGRSHPDRRRREKDHPAAGRNLRLDHRLKDRQYGRALVSCAGAEHCRKRLPCL